MASTVRSMEKELRFTRSGQAVVFWIVSSLAAMTAILLIAASFHRRENPALPHPAWSLAPLAAAVLLARTAIHLTRHAYLILTPLGIEIFPFFRPAAGMQLVTWTQIDAAETNASLTVLSLHHNPEKTSGIHLSLRPIRADRRQLLARAVNQRLQQGNDRRKTRTMCRD